MPRKGEGQWGGGNITGSIPVSLNTAQATTSYFALIAERRHRILADRKAQLEINLLGLEGGRPYVKQRLSRFAGESKAEWEGDKRKDGSTVTGRRDRAHNIPHLSRITNKLNEWIFSTPVKRTAADPLVIADITTDGDSVSSVMKDANRYLSATGWCWIGLNAPNTGGGERTVSEIEKAKLRPYWNIYSALEVVDWSISATGDILWLLTESTTYENADPKTKATKRKIRLLWERAGMATDGQGNKSPFATVTRFTYKPDDDNTIEKGEMYPLTGITGVPFVLVGKISDKPHAFDDLESINKTILDLESCNDENFYHAMFPQRYIPLSAIENVKEQFQVNAEEAVGMLFGLGYPIMIGPEDTAPGFITPDSAAMGKIREEIKERKRELYDAVGLMIAKETRQVESAEAKAWDHIDVEMFLKERAQILQEAETRAVAIHKEWDPRLKEWSPEYHTEYDIPNFKEEMEALVLGEQIAQPIELVRLRLRRLVELYAKRLAGGFDPDEEAILAEAIENFTGPTFETIPMGEEPAA